MDDNPFTRLDSASWDDLLTDAALRVLAEDGLLGLSVRAIAARIGITGPALTQRWKGDRGARARILQIVVLTFGERWHYWSRGPLLDSPPTLSLPRTEDEREGVRAWLAFHELARSEQASGNPHIATAVAHTDQLERDQVWDKARGADGRPLPEPSIVGLCALAEGLRVALVAPTPAIGVDSAERLLSEHFARLRGRPGTCTELTG